HIYDRQKATYAGTLTSPVVDYDTEQVYESLDWKSTLPFFKELPDGGGANSESTEDYSDLYSSALMEGVVGLWHMNNSWNDTSGNSNDGTASGNATFTTASKFGSHAGSFDGSGDYVSLGTT